MAGGQAGGSGLDDHPVKEQNTSHGHPSPLLLQPTGLAQCFTKQVLETTIPLMEMNTPPTEVVGEASFSYGGKVVQQSNDLRKHWI